MFPLITLKLKIVKKICKLLSIPSVYQHGTLFSIIQYGGDKGGSSRQSESAQGRESSLLRGRKKASPKG